MQNLTNTHTHTLPYAYKTQHAHKYKTNTTKKILERQHYVEDFEDYIPLLIEKCVIELYNLSIHFIHSLNYHVCLDFNLTAITF